MDFAIVVFLQILYAIASLTLMSLGLAVIFGMMRVINFAHGEFLMMGGYAFVLSAKAGLNIWLAMLVVAPVVVAAFSVFVERLRARISFSGRSCVNSNKRTRQSLIGAANGACYGLTPTA